MSPPVIDSPENAWRLIELTKGGYFPATEELGWPVISGKDSSNCRFGKIDAPFSLSIIDLQTGADVGDFPANVLDQFVDQTEGVQTPRAQQQRLLCKHTVLAPCARRQCLPTVWNRAA